MEYAQRDIMTVLLKHVYEAGLIGKCTYGKAVDLVHSAMDFPEFFRYTVCSEKEATAREYIENPRTDAQRENDL